MKLYCALCGRPHEVEKKLCKGFEIYPYECCGHVQVYYTLGTELAKLLPEPVAEEFHAKPQSTFE